MTKAGNSRGRHQTTASFPQFRYGLKSKDRCRAEHKPGYFTERCMKPLAHLGKHEDKQGVEF